MSMAVPSDWLVDTALWVSVLAVLVLCIRRAVARAFGPQIAYALWLLPLARAVLPPITLTVDAAPAAPLAQGAVIISAAMPAPLMPSFDPSVLILPLWLAGAALLAAYSIAAHLRLRRRIDADAVPVDTLGRIAIVSSAAVDGPIAIGLFRPQIVLPADYATRFSADSLRHVIAHEAAHHDGHDLAINLVGFALLCLNWFNPVAWIAWRAFRQDQEAACDARALARTGSDRASYGQAIAFATSGVVPGTPTAFTLAMGDASTLIHRLRSLTMSDISTRRRWAGRAALIAVTAAILPMTATVSYAVTQAEPTPPAPAQTDSGPRVTVIENGEPAATTERRIERDGRTIIVRTSGTIDDAEVDRIVANALADRSAGGSSIGETSTSSRTENGQRRIVMVRRSSNNSVSTSSSQTADAAATANSGGGQPIVRSQSTMVFRHDGAPGDGQFTTSCDDAPDARRTERTRGSGQGQHTVRIVSCGGEDSPATQLAALRAARASLAALPDDQIPGEARRSALAELDELIAEQERGAN
jgi:bla regulator protein blaR1